MDRSLAIKKRAQAFVQKGQVDAALAEFEKLFESGDKDPYDFILVADLLAKRGAMSEAVRRYRQAIEEYGKAELYKNAIAVCKKVLRIRRRIQITAPRWPSQEGSSATAALPQFARSPRIQPRSNAVDEVILSRPTATSLGEVRGDRDARSLRAAAELSATDLAESAASCPRRRSFASAPRLAPGIETRRQTERTSMGRRAGVGTPGRLARSALRFNRFGGSRWPPAAPPLVLESANGSR